MDGRFLDEHNLPDGNLYKMEGGSGDLNNQGPFAVTDKSDLNSYMNRYKGNPSEDWWRTNMDLPRYYSYRTVVEGIHHYDIGYGKNYFYYLNPGQKVGHPAVGPRPDLGQQHVRQRRGAVQKPTAAPLGFQGRIRQPAPARSSTCCTTTTKATS